MTLSLIQDCSPPVLAAATTAVFKLCMIVPNRLMRAFARIDH